MKIYDISLEITPELAVWPDGKKPIIKKIKSIEKGDNANVSEIMIGVHTGTHVDAPRHFIQQGRTAREIPLEILIGETYVCNIIDVNYIDNKELESLNIPTNTKRILFRTKNSLIWQNNRTKFYQDFVALTPDAASWLVSKGIKLVGIDYLSIQLFKNFEPNTHQILLAADVIILEGLILADVPQGVYKLVCLPLRLRSDDGAPARAVLFKE